jgi:hypothetical protein
MRFLKIGILVFVIIFSLTSLSRDHKYYVSVTDVEFVTQKKSVQIISRLFIDDLETVLNERYDESIKINENFSSENLIKYFSAKMLISIDDNLQKMDFVGFEIEDDMVHCYFEIKDISEMNSIKVINNLMFEVFDSQQNITHINAKGKKKSFLFSKDNATGLLKF